MEVRYPFLAVLCSNFLSFLRIVDQFQDGVKFEQQSNVVEGTEALINTYNETRIQAFVREFENIQGKLQDFLDITDNNI